MQHFRWQPLAGGYALNTTPEYPIDSVSAAQAGIVRIAAGTRSPERGLRTSAAHEIAYVISGHLRIETASESFDVRAGDVLAASPAADHSTTAVEDSEIFFVLLEPHLSTAPPRVT